MCVCVCVCVCVYMCVCVSVSLSVCLSVALPISLYVVNRSSHLVRWPDGTQGWLHSQLPLLPVCTNFAVQGQVPKVRWLYACASFMFSLPHHSSLSSQNAELLVFSISESFPTLLR